MEHIAILGAGNIGEALISGLVASGVDPKSIVATNRTAARSTHLAKAYGIETGSDNRTAAKAADAIVLCVKPAQIAAVLDEISEEIDDASEQPVVISMAAGVTIAAIEEAASAAGVPVARVMPNTPMLVGKGVLAVAFGRFVDDGQREAVRELLAPAGTVVEVAESQMDAVTAISGSGPAYYFLLTEALVDAGVSLGLTRELASKLAAATAAGAGEMLAGDTAPSELRAGVCSPAGTTVAAIREFEESGLRGAVYRAASASAIRSAELGKRG